MSSYITEKDYLIFPDCRKAINDVLGGKSQQKIMGHRTASRQRGILLAPINALL